MFRLEPKMTVTNADMWVMIWVCVALGITSVVGLIAQYVLHVRWLRKQAMFEAQFAMRNIHHC
jgi:hypothetical protein